MPTALTDKDRKENLLSRLKIAAMQTMKTACLIESSNLRWSYCFCWQIYTWSKVEDGAGCLQWKRNAGWPIEVFTLLGCLGPVLWINEARQADFKALACSCPCFTALSTENTSWHVIKPQFYGGVFLSHM